MSVSTESHAPAAPLVLPSELTHAQGSDAQRMLAQAMRAQRSGAVVLDGSQLRRFDSTALAVILACRRTAQEARLDFRGRNLPPYLLELAVLYGVDELVDVQQPAAA